MSTNEFSVICEKIETLRTDLVGKHDHHDEKIEEIRTTIYGDEADDKPGLKLKVDRLVETERRRDRLLWLVLGVTVAGMLGWVGHLFLALAAIQKP